MSFPWNMTAPLLESLEMPNALHSPHDSRHGTSYLKMFLTPTILLFTVTNYVVYNSSELHVISDCNYPMLAGGKSLI